MANENMDRRDMHRRERDPHKARLARFEDERWERNRVNSENIKRWEACQLDPCKIHGHGPSTPCER